MADELTTLPPDHPVAQALAKKYLAEAESAQAEAAIDRLRLKNYEVENAINAMTLARQARKWEHEQQGDDFLRFYRFDSQVTQSSAVDCIDTVASWARVDRAKDVDCHVKIQFNSPGGSVIDGLALFDELQHWRRQGVKITTSTIGMAASMAGILLQAGDVRVMAPQSWLLIHKTSFGVVGNFDEIEDRVKWLDRVQARILDIFADRAKQAGENGTAGHPISRGKLARAWERKDYWVSSDEALDLGLVDEVR